MKILFVHLLNNFTGAPKVLATELKLLSTNSDMKISLLTSKTDGVLSELSDVCFFDNWYRWRNNRLFLLFNFIISQIRMFLFVLFHRFDVVYINTVIPFGAAIAAKLKHVKIIYHVHEIYLNSGIIKRFYYIVMRKCADRCICVSDYVKNNLAIENDRSCVIYNPVEIGDVPEELNSYLQKKFDSRIVFMPSSLKEYKGVYQFLELARMNSDIKFILLCSSSLEEMRNYFSNTNIPENLQLIGRQTELKEWYLTASITINLSLPDKWIETFGLTLTESLALFTPVIAPNFGGPKEIIIDGENGFLINPYDLTQVSFTIKQMFNDISVYKTIASKAHDSLKKFSVEIFLEKVFNELNLK